MIRSYKGHVVNTASPGVPGYTIDGKRTARGDKPRPTERAAWKAAKSEINSMKPQEHTWLLEANSLLRTCYSVACREGDGTNWKALQHTLLDHLSRAHRVCYPMPDGPGDE